MMQRVGLLLVVAALFAAVALSSAGARTAANQAICHRTSSATKPYVKLSVSASVARTHAKHPADIIPAPRTGCPTTLLAQTGGRALQVALSGDGEQPAGDPVGTGTATFRLRSGQGQVCYQVAVKNLPAAVAAHIHKGASGVAGPVVLPLATPNASGASRGCAPAARTLVAAILSAPAEYYVNVHTAEFPAGAVRGQLAGTSSSSLGTTLAVELKGSSEPNATGTAVVRLRPDAAMVCYRLHVANVTLPTAAAHIHKGTAGTNGPVVVPFNAPGADGNASGCAPADAALINDIAANPGGYYVNVHTKEHPAGAIRAQLG
jgi:hypothetical protein